MKKNVSLSEDEAAQLSELRRLKAATCKLSESPADRLKTYIQKNGLVLLSSKHDADCPPLEELLELLRDVWLCMDDCADFTPNVRDTLFAASASIREKQVAWLVGRLVPHLDVVMPGPAPLLVQRWSSTRLVEEGSIESDVPSVSEEVWLSTAAVDFDAVALTLSVDATSLIQEWVSSFSEAFAAPIRDFYDRVELETLRAQL